MKKLIPIFIFLCFVFASQNIVKAQSGYLSVTSNVDDASIFIDSLKIGSTPLEKYKLSTGLHSIQVSKHSYYSYTQNVIIADSETITIHADLKPNFGIAHITTEKDSEIWVDNKRKGVGKWTGELSGGRHVVKVKQMNKVKASRVFNIDVGLEKYVEVECPSPIYGTLNINALPDDVKITINDIDFGNAPLESDSIAIGRCRVVAKKDGYMPEYQHVKVRSDKPKTISFELEPYANDSVPMRTFKFKMFLGAGYQGFKNNGLYADFGFMMNRHIARFDYFRGLNDYEMAVYKSEINMFIGIAKYRIDCYSFSYGYQIPVINDFSIAPFVTYSLANVIADEFQVQPLKNLGNGSHTADILSFAFRLSYRYKFLQINVMPQYGFDLDSGGVFKELDSLYDLTGFSFGFGLDFFLN